MKKILILISTTALLASTTMAGPAGTAYIKGGGGYSIGENTRINNTKVKKKAIGFAELGAGYNIADNARIDLSYTHFFMPNMKGSFSNIGKNYTETFSYNIKTDFSTFLVNSYIDLFDAGFAKLFVGAGAGMAMTKVKLNTSYSKKTFGTSSNITSSSTINGTTISSSSKYLASQTQKSSVSSKSAVNFAYSLAVGASVELSQASSLEFTYSFRGILLSKQQEKLINKSTLNTHNGSVGVRFSL